MSENVKKKKTRGDILHEQMVLRGEIKEEAPQLNKGRFALIALIVLVVLAALVVVANWRQNVIEQNAIAMEADPAIAAEPDANYAGIYKLGSLVVIVLGVLFLLYAIIKLIAPKRRKPNRSI